FRRTGHGAQSRDSRSTTANRARRTEFAGNAIWAPPGFRNWSFGRILERRTDLRVGRDTGFAVVGPEERRDSDSNRRARESTGRIRETAAGSARRSDKIGRSAAHRLIAVGPVLAGLFGKVKSVRAASRARLRAKRDDPHHLSRCQAHLFRCAYELL